MNTVMIRMAEIQVGDVLGDGDVVCGFMVDGDTVTVTCRALSAERGAATKDISTRYHVDDIEVIIRPIPVADLTDDDLDHEIAKMLAALWDVDIPLQPDGRLAWSIVQNTVLALRAAEKIGLLRHHVLHQIHTRWAVSTLRAGCLEPLVTAETVGRVVCEAIIYGQRFGKYR